MKRAADYVDVKQERNNKPETWADVLIQSPHTFKTKQNKNSLNKHWRLKLKEMFLKCNLKTPPPKYKSSTKSEGSAALK